MTRPPNPRVTRPPNTAMKVVIHTSTKTMKKKTVTISLVTPRVAAEENAQVGKPLSRERKGRQVWTRLLQIANTALPSTNKAQTKTTKANTVERKK